MRRSLVSFVMGSILLACGGGRSGGAEAHDEATTTTGDETTVVATETPVAPQPEEGSPECAGCTYSSSPGHVGPSGGGGVAEWCMSAGEDAPRTCAMSCCRTARGG